MQRVLELTTLKRRAKSRTHLEERYGAVRWSFRTHGGDSGSCMCCRCGHRQLGGKREAIVVVRRRLAAVQEWEHDAIDAEKRCNSTARSLEKQAAGEEFVKEKTADRRHCAEQLRSSRSAIGYPAAGILQTKTACGRSWNCVGFMSVKTRKQMYLPTYHVAFKLTPKKTKVNVWFLTWNWASRSVKVDDNSAVITLDSKECRIHGWSKVRRSSGNLTIWQNCGKDGKENIFQVEDSTAESKSYIMNSGRR